MVDNTSNTEASRGMPIKAIIWWTAYELPPVRQIMLPATGFRVTGLYPGGCSLVRSRPRPAEQDENLASRQVFLPVSWEV